MNREIAADTFVAGFNHFRAVFHPVEVVHRPNVWLVRDAPRRSGTYRTEEIISVDLTGAEILQTIRDYQSTTSSSWCVCPINALDGATEEVKREMKKAGFRARYTSRLYVRKPQQMEPRACSFEVRRITDLEDLSRLRKVAKARLVRDEDIEGDRPVARLYAAFDGLNPVSWVQTVCCPNGNTWVHGMVTLKPYRQRGIATAVMTCMLQDDERLGIPWSVLLASPVGTHLYRTVGYEEIGALQIFSKGSA